MSGRPPAFYLPQGETTLGQLAELKGHGYANAKQPDDNELDAWMSEIRFRAITQIGKISRELEKNERARTDLHFTGEKQTKTQQLADTGISTSTANKYERPAPVDSSPQPVREHTRPTQALKGFCCRAGVDTRRP
jgi:hypothetical protein